MALTRDKFKELVASVAFEGILNNIIVRKVSGKDEYQLISGFRRLAALERVYVAQGRMGEFLEAEVPARVFHSLTDDEALRISFSENLARKDLTLWEIANYCGMIAEEHQKQGKSQGEIEKHLAEIIRKDERSVRRYLAVSSIQNENIRRELHSGSMTLSIGDVFTRQGLTEKGRAALFRLYKRFQPPPSFDSFDELAKNALELKKWSEIEVERILAISTAPEFLRIYPDDLRKRAEYLTKARNKPLDQILAQNIADLKNSIDKVRTKEELAPFNRKFSEKASALETRISETIKAKKMKGEVAISPVGVLKDKMIRLTVTAPVSDVQKVVQFTLKELKDGIGPIGTLFKRPPKLGTKEELVVPKEKIKVEKNAAIAFTIRLERLRETLKALAKDGFPWKEPGDEFLLNTRPDGKLVFARHGYNTLLIPCEADVLQQGVCVLPLRETLAVIAKCSAKKDEVCQVQVVPLSGESKTSEHTLNLKIQDMNYFLRVNSEEPKAVSKRIYGMPKMATSFDMEASALKDLLAKVLGCIDPREIRRAMTGILFRVNQSTLTLTGTDGCRLFEATKPHNGLSGSPIEMIVPFHTGNSLRGLLRKDTGIVKSGLSEEAVSFRFDGISLIGKPIGDADYPNYSMFKEGERSFTIPIAELRKAVGNLALVADPGDNSRLTIKTDGNHVLFANGKGEMKCAAEDLIGEMDVDINAVFLSDLAKAMDGERVEMRHSGTDNFLHFTLKMAINGRFYRH
jgi:DNA polymerase III sliding clamp (beta) subunit (PCNA family)